MRFCAWRVVLAGLSILTAPAAAQGRAANPEDAALLLADLPVATVDSRRDWQFAVEGALGAASPRNAGNQRQTERLSLDLQVDKVFGKHWRGILSDQLDVRWQSRFGEKGSLNTLREAYLSWQPDPEYALDAGRINARYGVAMGYNPSDYFRSGASRSIVALDPASLKKNRQGSVMLRGQTLWQSGSLTAILSPQLADPPATATFGTDSAATNRQNRGLLVLGQRLSAEINPQLLLYGEERQAPQLGFNLTGVLGQATVAYVEWSGGRSDSQLTQALQGPHDTAFRSRLATGLSYTTDNRILLTAEYDFNGAAPTKAEWLSLSQRPPNGALDYAQYRRWVQERSDLPTRQSLFLSASWQDALVDHLDFNAMLRSNRDDHSRLFWLEARYHWHQVELAVQWQRNSGRPGSEFGALPQAQALQLLLRYLF